LDLAIILICWGLRRGKSWGITIVASAPFLILKLSAALTASLTPLSISCLRNLAPTFAPIDFALTSAETMIVVSIALDFTKVDKVSVSSNSVSLIRDSSDNQNFSLDLLDSNRLTGTTAKIF